MFYAHKQATEKSQRNTHFGLQGLRITSTTTLNKHTVQILNTILRKSM
jgi:hypothetical protein